MHGNSDIKKKSMVFINLVWPSSYNSDACRKPTNPLSLDKMNFLLATTTHTSHYQHPKYIHFPIGGPLAFAVSLDDVLGLRGVYW